MVSSLLERYLRINDMIQRNTCKFVVSAINFFFLEFDYVYITHQPYSQN